MTRQLHEPANALLYKALDLPTEARQRFIADACAGEPELLELVRTLLARIEALDEFLESPLELPAEPRPLPAVDPKPGELVGNWRIVSELGRDGIGLVLLAERGGAAVAQTGALKLAHASPSAADPLGSFQRERQILSNLQHPDIARMVDAGAADGRPYFVMEHTDGLPVDQYCASSMLGLRQRVALFARVCQAVHHAHQHLVLHRDLKPANIVVGADGAPKVRDFGIAGEPGESGGWAPTALYASPEQLAGQPLGIGSDIYSLGAILYGLLTGRSPNVVEANGIINVQARRAPLKPSDAVTEAATRHYPPIPEFPLDDILRPDRKLARQLQGDLDQILLKALQPDPAQRYSSAHEFARDLNRYVESVSLAAAGAAGADVPVARRRFSFGAAVTGLLLMGGIGAALWHARESDRARAAAEQRAVQGDRLLHAMLFELNDALVPGPGAARDRLESAALAYLRPLAVDPRLQPALRRDVADAYERLAVITGKAEHRQTAQQLRADAAMRPGGAAPAAPAQLPAPAGNGGESFEQLASRRVSAASVFTRGQSDAGQLQQALHQFGQLQRDLDSFIQKHPDNAEAPPLAFAVLTQLVALRRLSGDQEGAEQAARQMALLADQQLKAKADDAGWRQRGVAQRALGEVLVEQGRNGDGIAELRKALASFEAVSSYSTGNEQSARDVADAHADIGGAMMAGDAYAAAETQLTTARDAYTALARLDPTDAGLRSGLVELEMARANVQNLQGRGRAAVQSLAAVHNLMAANQGGADSELATRVALLDARIQPRGTPAQAFAQAELALAELLKYSEKDPVDLDRLRASALAWQTTGEIGLRANKREPACGYLGMAAKRYQELAASKRVNAIDKQRQGQVQELRKSCL